MQELLQKVLTDRAVRGKRALPAVAAGSASEFLPWASE